MKVVGLDGRTHAWSLTGRVPRGDDPRPRSAGHRRARALLGRLFPFDNVLEEVHLPGCPADLYADFVLPKKRLVVEVQGRQHRAYVPHFHGSPAGFRAQRARDLMKAEWCRLNTLWLATLDDDRDDDDWERAVRAALTGPREAPPG